MISDNLLMISCAIIISLISFFLYCAPYYADEENKLSLIMRTVVVPFLLGGGLAYGYVRYFRQDKLLQGEFDD